MLPAGNNVWLIDGPLFPSRVNNRCPAIMFAVKRTASVPEDWRNYRPKQVELIEIIKKPSLLHLVGYLYYWQMGFNSVFKGLKRLISRVSW